MRAVVQRVLSASVEVIILFTTAIRAESWERSAYWLLRGLQVEGRVVSATGPGLLVLVGVHEADTEADADFMYTFLSPHPLLAFLLAYCRCLIYSCLFIHDVKLLITPLLGIWSISLEAFLHWESFDRDHQLCLLICPLISLLELFLGPFQVHLLHLSPFFFFRCGINLPFVHEISFIL